MQNKRFLMIWTIVLVVGTLAAWVGPKIYFSGFANVVSGGRQYDSANCNDTNTGSYCGSHETCRDAHGRVIHDYFFTAEEVPEGESPILGRGCTATPMHGKGMFHF